MTKKNLFTLVLCLFCLGTTTHAQHIPTLEEAVYGGLIKTEGGSNVSWMKDGERYSKIEKNAEGAYEVTAYKAKDNSYPMRSHGIYEGEGTSLHLRKTMADYWLKNLPAGGK